MPKTEDGHEKLLTDLMGAESVEEAADILQSAGYELTSISAAPEEVVDDMEDAAEEMTDEPSKPKKGYKSKRGGFAFLRDEVGKHLK